VTSLITVLGCITAIAAAVRSTWSPCGLSMLSTITPVGERARGNRYHTTAAWFVAGATAGGATLGGGAAMLAAVIGTLHLSASALLSVAAAGGMLAVAGDAGLGAHFPLLRRQVNEQWLVQFRGWFYGFGFGWQIGVGVATYVMTAAVFLAVLLAALTANPAVALGIGTVFGLTRGAAVLLGRRLTTPAELRVLHQRLDAVGERVRWAVIGIQLAVALVASAAVWPPAAAVAAAGLLAAGIGFGVVRQRAT
jgi:hypothetical protein